MGFADQNPEIYKEMSDKYFFVCPECGNIKKFRVVEVLDRKFEQVDENDFPVEDWEGESELIGVQCLSCGYVGEANDSSIYWPGEGFWNAWKL